MWSKCEKSLHKYVNVSFIERVMQKNYKCTHASFFKHVARDKQTQLYA